MLWDLNPCVRCTHYSHCPLVSGCRLCIEFSMADQSKVAENLQLFKRRVAMALGQKWCLLGISVNRHQLEALIAKES